MFPKQSSIALFHALSLSSMPVATVVGLVLFGMLTAPPPQQKPPETVSEVLSLAQNKARRGKFDEALALYDRAISNLPQSGVLANSYWGRGAAHLQHFTRLNTKVRSLKLKAANDNSWKDDYGTARRAAESTFERGIADLQKAAEIAEASGLVACAGEIRESITQAETGMKRYNFPYELYVKRANLSC